MHLKLWPTMLRVAVKSLTGFKLCATTPNQHATTCNRVCKWMQRVTFQQCWELLANNVASVYMAEPKCETGEKNVLYIQGCDDLISTEMCGRKIIHELV